MKFMAIEMNGKKFNTFFDLVFADHDTLKRDIRPLWKKACRNIVIN